MSIRFRFSLRVMFATIAVAAVLAMYIVTERRYRRAVEKFEGVRAGYEAGVTPTMDLCAESFALFLVDSDRWFRTRNGAMASHVERLKELEQEREAKFAVSLYSDHECEERLLDNIRILRKRLEQELQ